jgi:hypothetical protein
MSHFFDSGEVSFEVMLVVREKSSQVSVIISSNNKTQIPNKQQ